MHVYQAAAVEPSRADSTENGSIVVNRRKFFDTSVAFMGAALLPGYVKARRVLPLPPDFMPDPTPGRTNNLKQTVRFGLLTDLHYADIPASGTRIYRDSYQKAIDCIAVSNEQKVDFVIETGDFKDQGPDAAATLSYLQAIETELQKFNGPTYHVLGNHDADNISKTQFLANIRNTDIPPDKKFYSFDKKGVHFVVLDANYRSDGADYDSGNFDWTDANIPKNQLDWIAADLASAKGPAIVFVHQLLDGTGSTYVKNAAAVRTVLENSGKVAAVFQGHHHAGSYKLINGIHYYTLKAMVERAYPANNAFAIVEIIPNDRIIIDGYISVDDKELILQ